MDLTVILGMVISVTSIAVGDIMEGGNPLHVLHITSFIRHLAKLICIPQQNHGQS